MRRLSPIELHKAVMDGRKIGNHEMTLISEDDHWFIQGGGFTSAPIRKIVMCKDQDALLLIKILKYPKPQTDEYVDLEIPLGIFDLRGGFLIEEGDQ